MNRLLFGLLYYSMIVVWGSCATFRAILEFVKHPLTFFHQKKRDVQPEILQDPSYGTHKYVTANGIKFHYVANGTEGKPLMLFLHGFPEFWFSWRFQLPEFGRDYYAVAVDLRGYGDTERPPHKKDYQLEMLTQDIAELIPALGYSSCVLVAHDWGGMLAWTLIQSHPELVDRFVVMDCPHYKIYMKTVSSNWKQFMNSWYMFVYQLPYLPEIMMCARDYKLLERVFFSKAMGLRNKEGFSKEVMEAFKYTFSKPGAFTAAINYHRNAFKSTGRAFRRSSDKVEKPVLLIWGDEDGALVKEMADQHDSVATNLIVKHIPKCSHWVQQDRPDLVNQYMREFLQDDVS
ncbi:epoxide hydrolase 4-like [Dysidea avara]|uniref:epoxide hydrolase 4-like n=1 Tax=Dysidea avara TaxID=196820 RepID=UPI0033289DB5